MSTQVIQRNKPSFGEMVGGNLGGGISQGFSQAMQAKEKQQLVAQEFSNKLGMLQKEYDLKSKLAGEERDAKSKIGAQDADIEKENFDKIKTAFGEKFANIWQASPAGARTELTKHALDAKSRGIDIDKVLSGQQSPMPEQNSDEYKLNTERMNEKNIIDYKTALRKENLPIWKESVDKKKGYKELGRDIRVLRNLDKRGNLPEGLEKLIINPETGAPYDLATAVKDMHPDVQQWVKTIARQATQAQTAFPGRVTNFDLQSYMRQFPSLFNTHEGREVILNQMELVNEANELFEDALVKVYQKHKLNGITPEDALELTENKLKDKLEVINKKIEDLSSKGVSLALKEAEEGSNVMDVYDASGQKVGTIDMKDVGSLPEGYTIR